MSCIDDIKLFANWEEKRKLFEWKVCGVMIWQYIRDGVFRIVDSKRKGKISCEYYHYISEKNEKMLHRFANEIPKQILFQKDVLFVNRVKRNIINGISYSPYLDGLLERLNYTYYVLEPARLLSGTKIITKNCLFYQPDSMGVKFVYNEKLEEKVKQFCGIIERDFNIKLDGNDISSIKNSIYSVTQNREIFRRYYKYILSFVKPKVIVIICAEHQENRYLIEVAKERGIPVIGYDDGCSDMGGVSDYYNVSCQISTYPDYRWCYSRETIDSYKLPIPDNKIVAVGNEFHNIRISQLRKEKSKSGIYKTILFISDYNTESGLAELAVEVSNKINNDKYKVLFKLHPGEVTWREKYPCLLNSKVKICGADMEKDINLYIVQSDFIVGTASTALAEGVELGKTVYIYGKANNAVFSGFLYKNNHAFLVESIEHLIQLIETGNKNKFNINVYEKNTVKIINEELKKIIK